MTDKDRLGLAKNLLSALEQGDDYLADKIVNEIAGIRETQLFFEMGKLTRQLHDSMSNFSIDSKFSVLAETEIPDAKERLHYVISMTEQAADQTLTVVEDLLPVAQTLNEQAEKLAANWDRFLVREMPYEEFKGMSHEITEYFKETAHSFDHMQKGLNDILMAQGFQDITGQVIRRVITLVEELESNLVDLIRITGGKGKSDNKTQTQDLPGPVVPGVDDKAGDIAASQDDVDDLLSSLGF